LQYVFDEENVEYEPQYKTEPGSIVDFIFPTGMRYASWDGTKNGVHMLAAKTTLKDRWRQVLDEAKKLPEKHVFTLAEGVSERQFRSMNEAGLVLVVPSENVAKFPPTVRPELLNLSQFVTLVGGLTE